MTLHSSIKKVPVFFLLFFTVFSAVAQKLEIGLGGGVMNYRGDVAPGFYPKFSRPAGSFFVRHNASHAVSFKFSFAYGQIFGDDAQSDDTYAKARGWKFNTEILELGAAFEYNFLNFRDFSSRKYGSPYLHIGVAGIRFGDKTIPNPSYSTTQVVVPFGIGYRRAITGNLNLGIEFGARKTFTDFLDTHGDDLTANRIQNGNPYNRDMYFFSQIMLSYTFYTVQCPFPRR